MATTAPRYQKVLSPKLFAISARPRKDSLRCCQDDKTFSSFLREGPQLVSPSLLRRLPSAMIKLEDHRNSTGKEVRVRHDPNRRPLHLDILSLAPVASSYFLNKSTKDWTDMSELTKTEVSSAYWHTFTRSVPPGRGNPSMFGSARIVQARDSATKT